MKKLLASLLLFTFIFAGAYAQQVIKTKARLNHIAIYVHDLKKKH